MLKDGIYLGDCLELMKNIEDKSIDCIICDLPKADCELEGFLDEFYDALESGYTKEIINALKGD